MSAKIIRTQSEVATASDDDLKHTYEQLTGKPIKRFKSRAAAERRTIDAIMAAEDKRGHLGVGKNVKPEAATVVERVDIAAKKGLDPADQMPKRESFHSADDGQRGSSHSGEDGEGAAEHRESFHSPDDSGVEGDDDRNPYPPGTMAHGLWVTAKAASKIVPKPKAAPRDPNAPKRKPVESVKATFAGKSRPQPGSDRNAVLIYVQNAKDEKGQPRAVTVEELEAHFQKPCRGFIQKLLEKEHVVLVEEEQKDEVAA